MKTKSDLSYGVMPLRKCSAEWQTLLVQHRNGNHYGFPKGHPEPGELPQQTASRELCEETGLKVIGILRQDPFWESYFFQHSGILIRKKVGYFPALVQGELAIQEEEIAIALWVSLQEALQLLSFKESRSLCIKLFDFLHSSGL